MNGARSMYENIAASVSHSDGLITPANPNTVGMAKKCVKADQPAERRPDYSGVLAIRRSQITSRRSAA